MNHKWFQVQFEGKIFCIVPTLNPTVMWTACLLHIQEVWGSNPGPETGYPDVFRGPPQPFQANAGAMSQIRP